MTRAIKVVKAAEIRKDHDIWHSVPSFYPLWRLMKVGTGGAISVLEKFGMHSYQIFKESCMAKFVTPLTMLIVI